MISSVDTLDDDDDGDVDRDGVDVGKSKIR
jgi:hypothetical protein